VVVTAALAAMLAESIAMAGVAYTATGAEQSWARRARQGLTTAIEHRREARREQRHAEYGRQGHPDTAVELAEAAAADEAAAWATELDLVERELAPIRATHPVRAAITVGLSTVVGSAVPLTPLLVLPVGVAVWVSLVAGISVLFAVGVYRAHATEGGLMASGLQMAIIGLMSALAGYAIGVLLRTPATA
jgi:VIT1/CCC1 family predicted Fe2+/Mn2+ transporter